MRHLRRPESEFYFQSSISTPTTCRLPKGPAVVDQDANLIPKVIEYLVKKGYNRTEQMLRLESSRLDREGRPIQERVEDTGTEKYATAYKLLDNWIKQNLSIYKVRITSLGFLLHNWSKLIGYIHQL